MKALALRRRVAMWAVGRDCIAAVDLRRASGGGARAGALGLWYAFASALHRRCGFGRGPPGNGGAGRRICAEKTLEKVEKSSCNSETVSLEYFLATRAWRNRQTRWLQVPVGATP